MKRMFPRLCAVLLLIAAPLAAPVGAQQAGDPYADRVVTFTPGNPASERFNNPDAVLGPPDLNEAALRGWLTLGVGGSVTVEFVNNVAVDGPGPDIQIVGDPRDDEQWIAEVSADGTTYKSFGKVGEQAALDLATVGLASARFVRLTDDGDPSGGMSPGAELDAVVALNSSALAAGAPTAAAPVATAPAAGASLTWVRLGGPFGGLGYDIRMRPDNPDVMFVTDSFAGLHVSTDGGMTWLPSNEGIDVRAGPSGDAIPVFSATVDPNDPDIVWAGTQASGAIYRSVDGGRTWEKRTSGIAEGQGLSFRGFAVEPGNSDVVYAAGEVSSWVWVGRERRGREFDMTQGVVYKTTNSGQNWKAVWRGDNLARYIWIDPRNTNVIYVSTGIFDREAANSDPATDTPGGVGVLKSTDGGRTWRQINEGLQNLYVGSLFMHPTDPDVLLAGAGNNAYYPGGGIYLTTDGGEHWKYMGGDEITSVEFALSDPNVAYAGGEGEFYRSEDGGLTWKQLARDGRWGPEGIRPGFPIDFQVDPRDPDRIFANNYGGGNFLSEDGGLTWVSASTGYTGADIIRLALNPQNAANIFTSGQAAPFVSTDGGRTWTGLNPSNVSGFWMVALDPADPAHVLAANNEGLLFESKDGGGHWEAVLDYTAEIGEGSRAGSMSFFQGVWALTFAPSDPSKVYAGFANSGCASLGDAAPCRESVLASLVTSEDGGHTWTRRTGTPFDGALVMSIVVHPARPDEAWIATPGSGIFHTTDGGATWEGPWIVYDVWPEGRLRTMAAAPGDANIMYAGTGGSGVFKSEDGGLTWRMSSAGMEPNEMIEAIVVDPVRPNVVYAGSKFSGVYLSEDAGASWRKINDGLRTRSIRSLAISADGETLYAGTRHEGVFRLSTLTQEQFDALAPAPTTTPTADRRLPTASAPPAVAPLPAPTAQPPGGFQLPCLGGALPLAAGLIWMRRRKARK